METKKKYKNDEVEETNCNYARVKSIAYRIYGKFRLHKRKILTFFIFALSQALSSEYSGTNQQTERSERQFAMLLRTHELNEILKIDGSIGKIVSVNDEVTETNSRTSGPEMRAIYNEEDGKLVTNPQIKALEIQNHISYDQLQFLFKILPKLQHFSIDLSFNCDHTNEEENHDLNLGDGEMPQLQTIQLENGHTENCEMLLQLLSLKLKELRNLTIRNSTFNSAKCRMLERFLHEASESLQDIEIRETYLNDCDFRELMFPQLRNLIVLEPDEPATSTEL